MRPLAMYRRESNHPSGSIGFGQPLIVMNFLTWPAVTPCLGGSLPKCAGRMSDFGCKGCSRRRLTPQRI